MKMIKKVVLLGWLILPLLGFTGHASQIKPMITSQIFDKCKLNSNWKIAFFTGKSAQIVFMNITPHTNPKNEIGMETHKFDQVIFIAEGNGKMLLNGQLTMVKSGDMIFVPEGVAHNLINQSAKKPLKILSVYSAMDMPKNAVYMKKSDDPENE